MYKRNALVMVVCVVPFFGMAQRLGALVSEVDGMHEVAVHDRERSGSRTVELEGFSTDGGLATGYFRDNGALFLAEVQLLGEGGRTDLSLYIRDDSLRSIREWSYTFNRPYYWTEEVARSNDDDEAFDPSRTKVELRMIHLRRGAWSYVEPVPAGHGEEPWLPPEGLEEIVDTVLAKLRSARLLPDVAASPERVRSPMRPAAGPPLRPDTVLCGVALHDQASAEMVLGSPQERLAETEQEPFPHVSYRLQDGGGGVSFVLHYGSGKNQFSEFCLSRAETDTPLWELPTSSRSSGAGIQLGMSLEEVLTKLGPSTAMGRAANGHRLVRYAILAADGSRFLEGYNMPSYYMTLEFGQEGLVEYRFGFEYP